jgi:GNAT superfamily N-acetyltransferase
LIITILDASCDGNYFANSDKHTINVGDLYLKSAYRGKNVAQELLQYVSNVLKRKIINACGSNMEQLIPMHKGSGIDIFQDLHIP